MPDVTLKVPGRESPDHTFMFLLMAIPLLLGAMGIMALASLVIFLMVLL